MRKPRSKSRHKPRAKLPAAADPKVRQFPRAHVEPFDPIPAVIHHCERLLQDAKSGRLRGMAYATIYNDDLSPAGSVDHGFCCGSGTYYAMSHGVRRLVHAWDIECGRDTTGPAVSPPPKPA